MLVKQRGGEVIENTHTKTWHFSPKWEYFHTIVIWLDGRADFIQLFSIFFLFFLRSEKVSFWALRTKTATEKVLAALLARRTGTVHHSATAAPSFLISSNLWFQRLQAILACARQRSRCGGGFWGTWGVNQANFTVCDHKALALCKWSLAKIHHVWNFTFI